MSSRAPGPTLDALIEPWPARQVTYVIHDAAFDPGSFDAGIDAAGKDERNLTVRFFVGHLSIQLASDLVTGLHPTAADVIAPTMTGYGPHLQPPMSRPLEGGVHLRVGTVEFFSKPLNSLQRLEHRVVVAPQCLVVELVVRVAQYLQHFG